jgi:hypothetical protein
MKWGDVVASGSNKPLLLIRLEILVLIVNVSRKRCEVDPGFRTIG